MIGTQRQSDKQAAQVLNPAHLLQEWDAFGILFFQYIESLALSPWLCDRLYDNLEDSFFNVMTAYYFLQLNIMNLQKDYGDEWFRHTLPRVTLQNTFADCGHFVARALYYPRDIPFILRKQLEWTCETHFSDVKKYFRGMPKYKDMIIGETCNRHQS